MGLIREFRTSVRKKRTPEEKKKARAIIEKQMEEDARMVTGTFRNYTSKNEEIQFTFKKYKEDSYKDYKFIDGEEATIPYGVAKHINTRSVPIREYAVDAKGRKTLQTVIRKMEPKYEFIPKSFT